MTIGNTAIGQTFFQLISSMGNVNQDWDTTTASGPGAFAVNDANLSGTQIVMGDNDGQMVNGSVHDSVVGEHNNAAIHSDGPNNFGSGLAIDADDVNIGSGEQYNVENSDVSESAFGHSQVQSNDMDLDDGSAVAFGGDAQGANVDADVWGNDGNVAIQAGEDQVQNQLNDESVEHKVKLDFDLDNKVHNGDTNTIEDSFKIDDSFNPFSHNDVDNDVFDIA